MERIGNGIWKVTLGEPEALTPVRVVGCSPAGADGLPACARPPFGAESIRAKKTAAGFAVELPLSGKERIYGFGLQLKKLNHTGRKEHLRVNSDPVCDTGDSHAPVPFYVSTAGYGVYVDTARAAKFYCGTGAKKGAGLKMSRARSEKIADNTGDLYALGKVPDNSAMLVEIPAARGVDLYIFAGPELRTAVQRYNLFSGGGCLPPLWGLGVWYRVYGRADQAGAEAIADGLRASGMPCDVLGLEPGWQSHSYSCSYDWDPVRFPRPDALLAKLKAQHFKVNLWEHAFVHPTAGIYGALTPFSGDYEVWGGLVPDFATDAQRIFADDHGERFVKKGVSGFKLDECDNSDYNITNWSFPDSAAFPSGLDGEQMHSLLGLLYQRTLSRPFREAGRRTYGQVRSSWALAAPLPFVLYSDLYDHRDFIRGTAGMGFSGLLWSPEVRGCASAEDLIRRLQSVVFSPQALINAWMIPSPPWVRLDFEKAPAGDPLADAKRVEAVCRRILEMRMSLVPYLYAAFADYHFTGMPPFRALAMDYPRDAACAEIDDAYLVGPSLLAAPLTAGQSGRYVYLPAGEWCDFYTGQKYRGGERVHIMPPLDQIPLFVRAGSVIPWAKPVQHIGEDTVFDLELRCYGAGRCTLYEDDGVGFGYESGAFDRVTFAVDEAGRCTSEREGPYPGGRYRIAGVRKFC